MKRVERNPQRQRKIVDYKLVRRKTEQFCHHMPDDPRQDVQNKRAVFEDAERQQINDNSRCHPKQRVAIVSPALDCSTEPKIQYYHNQNEWKKNRLAPGVKYQAKKHQGVFAKPAQQEDRK